MPAETNSYIVHTSIGIDITIWDTYNTLAARHREKKIRQTHTKQPAPASIGAKKTYYSIASVFKSRITTHLARLYRIPNKKVTEYFHSLGDIGGASSVWNLYALQPSALESRCRRAMADERHREREGGETDREGERVVIEDCLHPFLFGSNG